MIAAHADYRPRRLANLALFPLCRFRRINIYLTPQLSHLSLPKGFESRFFPEGHEFYHRSGRSLEFDMTLKGYADRILNDAEEVAKILKRQLASTKAMLYGPGTTEVKLKVNEAGTSPLLDRIE